MSGICDSNWRTHRYKWQIQESFTNFLWLQLLVTDDFLADICFENWKRNREDFVRSAHDRFNYANQDMTMCRKRIIEHFFTGPSSIDLTWVKNFWFGVAISWFA